MRRLVVYVYDVTNLADYLHNIHTHNKLYSPSQQSLLGIPIILIFECCVLRISI